MQQHDTQADAFTVFTEERLEQWRKHSSIQSLNIPDKGLIYRQGDVCPFVFWITKGIVKLSHLTEQGNEWTVALLRRGDIIGCLPTASEVGAMEETAQAIGEVQAFRLELRGFRQLIVQQPDLSWQLFEAQCIRRQKTEHKLLNILALPVENRVLEMLKELADLFGIRCTHGYALEIQLSQQELADLVGASRPVVSTIMNELRVRGILDYTRDLICVKDALFFCSARQV